MSDKLSDQTSSNIGIKTLRIKGHIFEIECVENTNTLLDSISVDEFNIDERLPYWAEIWPSSIALSEYILDNKNEFLGKSIIELGCGLGLTGIAAKKAGGDVLFTDYEEEALKFTKRNYRRNINDSARVKLFDWRKIDLNNQYDIIIAADILYEKRWLDPIMNVLKKLLKTGGVAFIAEPNRTLAKEFFQNVDNENWQCYNLLKRVNFCSKLYTVSIHRIIKC